MQFMKWPSRGVLRLQLGDRFGRDIDPAPNAALRTRTVMAGSSHWQQAWDEARPVLRKWRDTVRNEIRGYVPRVGQLDAELLDEEITLTLQEPIKKAFTLVDVSIRYFLRI